jgi:hypothetical protein
VDLVANYKYSSSPHSDCTRRAKVVQCTALDLAEFPAELEEGLGRGVPATGDNGASATGCGH